MTVPVKVVSVMMESEFKNNNHNKEKLMKNNFPKEKKQKSKWKQESEQKY